MTGSQIVEEVKPSATEQHFAAVRAVHESPLLGTPCPVCTGGTIGQSGTFLRCGNCGWLRDPSLSDRHRRPLPYCECGAVHSDGTEESDSGICSCCGGLL